MPHIHLEYSDNLQQLEVKALLSQMNRTLVENGLFPNASNFEY